MSNYYEQTAKLKSSESEFILSVELEKNNFMKNQFVAKIENSTIRLDEYHRLLSNLFYQVFYSSSSFARAASICTWDQKVMRDYLIRHSEEEKTHWCWILDDLKNTNCVVDPRMQHPSPSSTAYFSYAFFLANRNPILRLAMAYFLEGLSADYGGKFGKKLATQLSLKESQLSFFLNHGDLDGGHADEVMQIIKKHDVPAELWSEMINVVHCTSYLYRELYNV